MSLNSFWLAVFSIMYRSLLLFLYVHMRFLNKEGVYFTKK